MKTNSIIRFLLIMNLLLFFVSCEDSSETSSFEESAKSISGKWKVNQLYRGSDDLSNRLRLEDYIIQFKEDGTYVISDDIPFVVSGSGSYSLDDPKFPFNIILKPESSNDAVKVKFQFPIVDGKRQLSLTFSLGCKSNVYQYSFVKLN